MALTVYCRGTLQPSGNKGRRQNSPQLDDKNMLENIGDLFVKCMREVTKGHFVPSVGGNELPCNV